MNINFSNEPVHVGNDISIFLAGPTLRDSCFEQSWRKYACDILEKEGFNGTVYVPEFSCDCQRDYIKQTLWERKALENSTYILFWINRDMSITPGLTTNVEFGAWLERDPDKVWLGYPEFSEKMRYLEWFYNYKTGRVPFSNMRTMIKHILKISK